MKLTSLLLVMTIVKQDAHFMRVIISCLIACQTHIVQACLAVLRRIEVQPLNASILTLPGIFLKIHDFCHVIVVYDEFVCRVYFVDRVDLILY